MRKPSTVVWTEDTIIKDTALFNGRLQSILLQVPTKQAIKFTADAMRNLFHRRNELTDPTVELIYKLMAHGACTVAFLKGISERYQAIELRKNRKMPLDIRRNL